MLASAIVDVPELLVRSVVGRTGYGELLQVPDIVVALETLVCSAVGKDIGFHKW